MVTRHEAAPVKPEICYECHGTVKTLHQGGVHAGVACDACHSGKYLTLTATRLDWERIIAKDQTFAVSANINASKIRHSHYAALCLKDAVADHFTARYGKRPNVDKREPDVRLHLHIDSNRAIIYLDISGGALHKRGYRKETVDAPMQETIAAAIIAMSGWQGECPLIDPMCGSGTLLIEAMMQYCRIPAGILRPSFGLSGMPDFDAALWASVKKRATEAIRPLPANPIFGSDKDPQAIKSARTNAGLFEPGKNITIRQQTLLEATQSAPAVIVCNPPYGLRLQKGMNIQDFMSEFGSTLKHRFTGSTAYLFLGRRELVKMVGLEKRTGHRRTGRSSDQIRIILNRSAAQAAGKYGARQTRRSSRQIRISAWTKT